MTTCCSCHGSFFFFWHFYKNSLNLCSSRISALLTHVHTQAHARTHTPGKLWRISIALLREEKGFRFLSSRSAATIFISLRLLFTLESCNGIWILVFKCFWSFRTIFCLMPETCWFPWWQTSSACFVASFLLVSYLICSCLISNILLFSMILGAYVTVIRGLWSQDTVLIAFYTNLTPLDSLFSEILNIKIMILHALPLVEGLGK